MEETLDDIKVEGELDLTEKETQTDSSTEDKPEEDSSDTSQDAKSEEEEVPFHENPRFKKLIEDRNTAREERDSLKEQMEAMDEKFDKIQTTQSSEDIPTEFQTLYGDNPKAWKAYKSFEDKREERILNKIREERSAETQKRKAEETHWNKWVDSELSNMEDEGLSFKKNDLMKFTLDWMPTDAEGNIDFRKGHKLMEMNKGSNSNVEAKKKVAAKSEGSTKAESGQKGYLTSDDIAGRSIRDIIQDELT